jgi:Spy/CpxP family protein refolding chaperone
MKRYTTLISFLCLFAGFTPSLLAQPPGEGNFEGFGQADGSRLVAKLNRALTHADAGELTEAQEGLIIDLVAEHRQNRPQPDPEARNSGLMKAYADAILSGDPNNEIPEIADQMAEQMAARTANHLVARANFQIGILNILTEDQIAALQIQYGEQGLLRLLNSRGRGGKRGGGPRGGPEGFSRGRGAGPARGNISGP